tara:strand:- start:1538 stop:1864 length:327 start_codon:yes stop_codon:yes gene_type:complete
MSEFFELRTYKIFPGKMEEWLKYMEKTIIPFQVSKGMVIHGSFTVDSDVNTYVWIRRFKDSSHKEKLYKEVYKSDKWLNEISPNVKKLVEIEKIVVHNLYATELSVMK